MVISCVVSFVTMRVQPESKVEAYKKFLRAQGEKLDIAELIPAPVPAASNSVDAVRGAFAMFGSGNVKIPDAMKMIAPGKAMIGWKQPEAVGSDFTNTWEDFAADIAANQPAIDLLHQVMERPKLDFQLDYQKNFDLPLPHLMQMKKASQKLAATAIFNLHGGDTGAATTNILTLLALVQKNEAEGVLISDLVRIAMTAIAEVPTWDLLQITNVTEAQLTALQKGWEQLDFIGGATNVFALERAWGIDTIEKARSSHEGYEKIFGLVSSMGMAATPTGSSWGWPPDWEAITEKPRYAVAEIMWRSSWSYTDELRTLKTEQIILEALRLMQTKRNEFYKADYDEMVKKLSSLGIANAGGVFFRALKIPDMSGMFGDWGLSSSVLKILRTETVCRIAATAIALKRFQLQHGQWPELLNELVPEFIVSIPIDPYDGKPLKYHPNTDGTYLLYSVAENGVDDGGSPTLPSESKGMYWQYQKAHDWVWPQPATAEEIKAYYDAETAKAAAESATEAPAMTGTPVDPATGLPLPPPPVPAGTN